MVNLRFFLSLRSICLVILVFVLLNVLNTAIMAGSFDTDKGLIVVHTGKKTAMHGYKDVETYTVNVKVSPSDLKDVTVCMDGYKFYEDAAGTDVTFDNVPEGDYNFRAVCGSREVSESGRHIDEDVTVYLKF